jgi:hypothetical protein
LLSEDLQLHLPGQLDRAVRTGFASSIFPPLRFWGVPEPIPAPAVPDWNLTIPPLPGPKPFRFLGFQYDHVELQPGGQTTFNFGSGGKLDRPENMFTLTMQTVYRRGPDDDAHQELDLGVQLGAPVTAQSLTGGPWTFNPYVSLMDVDRFGKLGMFHYWQPYAQLGAQISGPGDPHPTLSAGVFPVNLGLDVGDVLTIGLGAGFAASVDLQTGEAKAGVQLMTGLSLKLGRPDGPL